MLAVEVISKTHRAKGEIILTTPWKQKLRRQKQKRINILEYTIFILKRNPLNEICSNSYMLTRF